MGRYLTRDIETNRLIRRPYRRRFAVERVLVTGSFYLKKTVSI